MSTVPVPVRAATVAGTILAVIFITLSAVVGGVNVWRTRSAATYEAEASQAVSEKAAIDQQIIEAQTHLEAANAHRDAAAWCASVTRDKAGSMRDVVKSYDSATQAVKEAIHAQCADKESLANAQRTLSDSDFSIAIVTCTTDQVTTTMSGTLTMTQSSSVASFGDLDVTIIGYTVDKDASFNPSSPYQGSTTVTLTPGTPLTFTVSVPYDPQMSATSECGATMTSWWPSSM